MGVVNLAQLISIESKIGQLIANSNDSSELIYSQLILNPTYTLSTTPGHNWSVSPSNLSNMFDGDTSTSTNTFEIGGANGVYGEIQINPGISIPQLNRITMTAYMKSNNNNQFPFAELAVNTSGGWVNVWASICGTPMSDILETTISINAFSLVSWNALRIRVWDLGRYGTKMRISDIKIWRVS